jgi:hypothetical protein
MSEISGDKLYEENKEYIKNYVQQGDWLFIPKDDKLKTVNVCSETKLRLVSHVYYKLLEGNLNDTPIRALEMGNASWHQKTGRRHIEFVSDDIMNPDKFLIDMTKIGDTEAVRYALDHGVDVHANHDLAIICASGNGHNETVKLLLDHGADVHARNDYALRYASYDGYTETVKLLLDNGADVHAAHDYALRCASINGHTETVKLLLDHGANQEVLK